MNEVQMLKRFLMVSVVLMSAQFARGADCDATCTDEATKLITEMGPEAGAFFQTFSAGFDADVMSGRKLPKWDDFDRLRIVFSNLESLKKALADRGVSTKFEESAPKISLMLNAMPNVRAVLESVKTAPREAQFVASEYELKVQYAYAINDLNSHLPASLRVPFRRVPFDQRRLALNEQGRQMVRRMEPLFEANFASSIFESLDAYRENLKKTDAPGLQRALEIVEKGQIVPVIRRPESARFWLAKTGFHNQYVSGSSRGTYDPDKRKTAEARLLMMPADEYMVKDIEVMPKYGTLRALPESGLQNSNTSASHYGSDIFYLKMQNVADRLTFTPRDSLGLIYFVESSVADAQRPWDSMFIPWKNNFLTAPFLAEDVLSGQLTAPKQNPTILPVFALTKFPDLWGYWEIQVWGSVRLADVSAMEFSGEPPSGSFLLELLKQKIKIYDARSGAPVEWQPTAEMIAQAKVVGT